MRSTTIFPLMAFLICLSPFALSQSKDLSTQAPQLTWQPGTDVEIFWSKYTESKGGITFSQSSKFPKYEAVKEGDTFLIKLKQGLCLMEFFHSRWRRANDVRRWHDSINSYGGCPYVFD